MHILNIYHSVDNWEGMNAWTTPWNMGSAPIAFAVALSPLHYVIPHMLHCVMSVAYFLFCQYTTCGAICMIVVTFTSIFAAWPAQNDLAICRATPAIKAAWNSSDSSGHCLYYTLSNVRIALFCIVHTPCSREKS